MAECETSEALHNDSLTSKATGIAVIKNPQRRSPSQQN